MSDVAVTTTTPVLEFFAEPGAFLAVAGDFLAADPVLVTVVSTVTQRCLAGEVGRGAAPRWWVTMRASEGGPVEAVGMRTAPGGASPPYVTAMSDEAARALARVLVERGEVITQVNGALPAARVIAEETATLAGGAARIREHSRLHLLRTLLAPAEPPGRLRHAGPEDLEVCLAWWEEFEIDAAAQSGRAEAGAPLEPQDAALMLARVARRGIALWEDEHGEVVHLTAVNPPSYGVVRVGPVYTPAEQRGRGYASAAVAGVAAAAQREGHQVCLFTDQANPVSNRIYAALGFEAVVDMAHLEVG